jgi:transcriptional antiterminator RfaH
MLKRLEVHSASQWLVINTQPRRERLAIDNLRRQNFTVYCPMFARRVHHARRTFDARRPLFPSYVFVDYGTAEQRWRKILSTYGVRSVVRNGDEPSLLDGAMIESLKAREVDGLICKPDVPFIVGQRVVLQSGPLDGLIGEIIEMREKDRLVVLLSLLNQSVKLNVHSQTVARAG